MTFLQPFILWGLPLLFLPVVIHLINRLRHRPQPWAAMQFLLNAAQRSVSHDKLRHFLILLFRILAVAALLLFLARPLVGGWLGWALASAPDAVILVLDRSASMEFTPAGAAASRRVQSLALWAEALKPFEHSSHLILLDSATRGARELSSWRDLRGAAASQASDTAADLPDLLQRAFNYLVDNKPGVAEIWVASDLQRSNWSPDDNSRWQRLTAQFAALPQKVRFRLLTWPAQSSPNASLSLAEFARHSRNNQPVLTVALDLRRGNESTGPIKLTTTLNESRLETDLRDTGQSFRSRQTIPLPPNTESGWGSFEIPGDSNPRDNKVYFAFGADLPLRASIISADTKAGRVFQFAAADLGSSNLEKARQVMPSNVGSDNWQTNSLLIWQAPLPAAAGAERVAQFIREGGAVIFFPTDAPSTNDFEGLGFGAVMKAAAQSHFNVIDWNEIDGPLARTEEGLSLPVRQVEFERRAAISGAKDVLAKFSDGAPFLARQSLGKGEFYFCASLPSPDWSSLGDGPVIVPMMQRLLQAGGRRLQSANFAECGRLSNPDDARTWTAVTGGKDARFEAGIYKTATGLIAVNRPLDEDDPEIVAPQEMKRLFGDLSLQTFQDKPGSTDRLQGEIWRLFLILMLLFLMFEGFLILPPRNSESFLESGSEPPARPQKATLAA